MFDYQPHLIAFGLNFGVHKMPPNIQRGSELKATGKISSDEKLDDDDEKSLFSVDDVHVQKNDIQILQDDSLLNDEYVPRYPREEGQTAYKRRNVYKSIIRHMFAYIRKNRAAVSCLLNEKGFTPLQIEHAYYKMNLYNDLENQSGNPKKSQMILKKIVKRKCVYSYFLKLTLEYMLSNMDNPDIMKLEPTNKEIYTEVCTRYLKEVNNVIGHEQISLSK